MNVRFHLLAVARGALGGDLLVEDEGVVLALVPALARIAEIRVERGGPARVAARRMHSCQVMARAYLRTVRRFSPSSRAMEW
ncbi:hypothetical protein GCM10010289_83460 [Streptomyces violascens]|uniref:Uncharacterized protein n=1 Tax=Streptomyces violascens TaxID=67381 RepID=A0ABQ3QSW1_9ACTN|nr:hypothetical protein GCM10010289_83460 [Streptomyces violascens]GHI40374.1 hypothetical protein Sviol_47820 [Streptomyces violascens]